MDADLQKEAVALLKALADPTRLALVRLLAQQRDEQALCVCALAERLGVSQPAVSQHLAVLRRLGLVRGERMGVRTHYFLDREMLGHYRELVDNLLRVEP